MRPDASLRSYLVLSDVHLGARTTPAATIVKNLTAFFDDFSENSAFSTIDALFLAGDLWDDTLTFGSDVFVTFLPWFHRLLKFCSKHCIKLRILEGTPRHDRKQAATLEKIVEMFTFDLDFKYVAQLSIEQMTDLGLSVLYVPDECRHTAEAVQEAVEAALVEANLQSVDIAIMHGMFKYQLGSIPMNSKVHDEAWYLSRVKQYISIGHVHTASQYSRIVAQGSFDRLEHGQEERKGAVLIKETATGEWVHFFIENKAAKQYKTIVVSGTVEKALAQIDKGVSTLPDGSYVRIQAESTHPIFQGFETLRQTYPLLTFSKKAVAKEAAVVVKTVDPVSYKPIVLNRDTLTDAVCQEVFTEHALDVDDYRRLHALLEELHA